MPTSETAPATLATAPSPAIVDAAIKQAEAGSIGLIQKLLDQIERLAPTRKILFHQFKTKSVFNPTGRKDRRLQYVVYQNGHRIRIEQVHDREVELLNQLTPGRYLGNNVVVRVELGEAGAKDKMHIEYKNKTSDQRMANKSLFISFEDLIDKCVREGKGEVVIAAPRLSASQRKRLSDNQ